MESWEQWQNEVVELLQRVFDEALGRISIDDVDWQAWREFYVQGRSPRALRSKSRWNAIYEPERPSRTARRMHVRLHRTDAHTLPENIQEYVDEPFISASRSACRRSRVDLQSRAPPRIRRRARKRRRAGDDASLDARARAVHRQVLTLDSHVDVIVPGAVSEYGPNPVSQASLDKLQRGGIDAIALAIAVGPGPRTPRA